MGDKYIIELEDKPFHKEDGDFLYRVKGFNSLVFDMTGISKLTLYTAPDLGQVRKEAYKIGYKKGYIDGLNRISDYEDKIRKEAYEDGYKTAKVQCNIQAEKDMREVGERHYQRGLADAKCGYENGFENGMIVAWDAAKKIALMDTETSENVTGYFGLFRIMENLTPMQAIEKIRQYEQEKEEQIQVGDEVRNIEGGWIAVVSNIDGECMTLMNTDGALGDGYNVNRFTKTGRHFPEIAAVLKKMRGEQDG